MSRWFTHGNAFLSLGALLLVILAAGNVSWLGKHRPPGPAAQVMSAAPGRVASDRSESGQIAPRLCRFGVNAPGGVAPYDVSTLRVSWYQDYGVGSPRPEEGIEYIPTIRLLQTGPSAYRYWPDRSRLLTWIRNNPGSKWFIGNEPDIRFGQDNREPHVYARAYRKLYHLIKNADPSAEILAGSISQPTQLRLEYLNRVLDAYRLLYGQSLPVDAWSVNLYMFNEASCEHFGPEDCWGVGIPPGMEAREGLRLTLGDNDDMDLFGRLVRQFRAWMAENGYRRQPLYVSEFGILLPEWVGYPPARVNAFMQASFDYLLGATDPVLGNPADGDRLVQRFAWFSTADVNYNGWLYDLDTGERTVIGDQFAAYAAEIEEQVDFYPIHAYGWPAVPVTAGEPVTVSLTAQVANSGNHVESRSFEVGFYRRGSGGQEVLLGRESLSLAGCGDTAEAQVAWLGAEVGKHRFVVRVDSEGEVVESDDANNWWRQQSWLVRTDGICRKSLPVADCLDVGASLPTSQDPVKGGIYCTGTRPICKGHRLHVVAWASCPFAFYAPCSRSGATADVDGGGHAGQRDVTHRVDGDR